jgi:hypothetical protein
MTSTNPSEPSDEWNGGPIDFERHGERRVVCLVQQDLSGKWTHPVLATPADLAAAGYVPLLQVADLSNDLLDIAEGRDVRPRTEEGRKARSQLTEAQAELERLRAALEIADRFRCPCMQRLTSPERLVRCWKARGHEMGHDFSGAAEPSPPAAVEAKPAELECADCQLSSVLEPSVTRRADGLVLCNDCAQEQPAGLPELKKLEDSLQDILQDCWDGEVYRWDILRGVDLKLISSRLSDWRVARGRSTQREAPKPTEGPECPHGFERCPFCPTQEPEESVAVPACPECRSRETSYRRSVPLGSGWAMCPNAWHEIDSGQHQGAPVEDNPGSAPLWLRSREEATTSSATAPAAGNVTESRGDPDRNRVVGPDAGRATPSNGRAAKKDSTSSAHAAGDQTPPPSSIGTEPEPTPGNADVVVASTGGGGEVASFQERLIANSSEAVAVAREGLKLYERIATALERLVGPNHDYITRSEVVEVMGLAEQKWFEALEEVRMRGVK